MPQDEEYVSHLAAAHGLLYNITVLVVILHQNPKDAFGSGQKPFPV